MSEFLEIIMLLCFGFSWPLNLMKAVKSKSAKGISPYFYTLILIGYIAGIISKLMNESYMSQFSEKWYVLIFYIINLVMVALNLIVYFRNKALDEKSAIK